MSAAACALRSPVLFQFPLNPVPVPALVVGNDAQQTQTARDNTERLRAFHLFNNALQALCKQLSAAAEPSCVETLKDPTTLFTNITPWQMLSHLFTHHGKMSIIHQEVSDQEMRKPWHIDQPIESLLKRLEDGHKLAEAAHVPIRLHTIMQLGERAIQNRTAP